MKTWIKYVLVWLSALIAGDLVWFVLFSTPWVMIIIIPVGGLIIAALLSWQAKKEAK
jgi:hypothetical protein